MMTRNAALPILATVMLVACSAPEPYPDQYYEGRELSRTEAYAPRPKPTPRPKPQSDSRPRQDSTPAPEPTATPEPQPTPGPQPEVASQPTPAPDQDAELLYGVPVPGKPGFVTSPYSPGAGYIDVNGLAPGSKARDPYTNRVFRVP